MGGAKERWWVLGAMGLLALGTPVPATAATRGTHRVTRERHLRAVPAHRAQPATAPPPLSADTTPTDVSSTYGSGAFGRWTVDRFGLPAYRYQMDEATDPRAQNSELNGDTIAWHQVGNDAQHAFAANHGYTQLWSQARLDQWANLYQPSWQHYSGGYGYLNVDGHVLSTLYLDRPPGAQTERDFGVGYVHHRLTTPSIGVDEYVYAPYGRDPVLLHDVVIHNPTTKLEHVSWFEYWDVNPAMQPGFPGLGPRPRGLQSPTWDAANRTLAVAQLPDNGYADPRTTDTAPLSIFAAALRGPMAGYETNLGTFFGAGSRGQPGEVTLDRLSDSIAPPFPSGETVPGRTMFAFRAPVVLSPGQSVTLRYAYGMAHPEQVASIVGRYRAQADPLTASEHAWSAWLPQSSFPAAPWLSRELQWDAYTVRSRSTPEEGCGGLSILSQGGAYQYDTGLQEAFRDPLQHMLPMIYSDPALAREVLLYSAREQPQSTGAIPYAMMPLCTPYYFGGESDDMDFWLMWATAEYVMATRDFSVLDAQVPYAGGGSGTLWDHLKLAHTHQETVIGRGIHGLPNGGTLGDWADFSVETNQLTESTMVGAQLAYAYPLLASVAAARGDKAFAASLTADGAAYHKAVAREWTGQGWYSRGYQGGVFQISSLYSLAQPWALLADIPTPAQARTLVANFRRYLTGVGAACGPAHTGSTLTPDPNDKPGETAATCATASDPTGVSHDVAAWFALNGPMVWAYGHVDRQVPGADAYGWDELLRNTLAALATAYPNHWDGIISADDVCDAWWTPPPHRCGVPMAQSFDTQILHQPAWSMFSLIKLAGIEATAAGYDIAPHIPGGSFSLRLPNVGLASEPNRLRGYVTPQSGGTLSMRVATPVSAAAGGVRTFADGRLVPHTRAPDGTVTFTLPTRGQRPADWAVTW